ncbi:MAG: exosortase A, partial [Burkholderiales bacterium PBB4]
MSPPIEGSSTTLASDLHAEWRRVALAAFALMAWVVFLYRDTLTAMVTIWSRYETFTHGFLVPPIVCWLVWRQRERIESEMPQPMMGSLLIVGFVSFLWLLGDLAGINALAQFSFLMLIVLAAYAMLGWRVLKTVLFPVAFLFFCVTYWEFLLPQLMEWTANFTVVALRISGVPVYREGLQFVIPSGNWSVVEACSGVRYLISSITVGTLFAYLNYRSTKRRVLFVIVSI